MNKKNLQSKAKVDGNSSFTRSTSSNTAAKFDDEAFNEKRIDRIVSIYAVNTTPGLSPKELSSKKEIVTTITLFGISNIFPFVFFFFWFNFLRNNFLFKRN